MTRKQNLNFTADGFVASRSGKFVEHHSPIDGRILSRVAKMRPEKAALKVKRLMVSAEA